MRYESIIPILPLTQTQVNKEAYNTNNTKKYPHPPLIWLSHQTPHFLLNQYTETQPPNGHPTTYPDQQTWNFQGPQSPLEIQEIGLVKSLSTIKEPQYEQMRILKALKTAINFTSFESFTPIDFEKESNIWALSSRRIPTIPAGPSLPLAYSST